MYVGSLNPSWCTIFFPKIILFAYMFFELQLSLPVTWHFKHASKQECTSSGNLKMLIANGYLLLFVLYSSLIQRHWCREQLSAVVHLYNPVKIALTNSSALDSIPAKPKFFFQFLDLFEADFFLRSTVCAS